MSSQSKFIWIDDDVVLAIHEAQIAEHGGILGIRDSGLLASALNRPHDTVAYSSPDVAQLAALYALGVIKNHPFVDGNKRVGAVLLEVFLDLNGYDFTAGDEEMLRAIVSVAAGKMNDANFVAWIRQNSVFRNELQARQPAEAEGNDAAS